MEENLPRGGQESRGDFGSALASIQDARVIAIIGVMIAVVFVATYFVKVPQPSGGYLNLSDIAIFFVSFIFGPIVGGIAGAVGPSISDAIGYASYVPGTFVIHGLEGVVAGLIAWRGDIRRMVIATIAGCAVMIGGYFIYEWLILRVGIGIAGTDVIGNIWQGLAGAVVAIPLTIAVRNAYPPITTWGYRRQWQEED